MATSARWPRRRGNQPIVPQREAEFPTSMLHPSLRPHDPHHLQHHLSFSTFMARILTRLTEVHMRHVAYRGYPGDVVGVGTSFGVSAFPNRDLSSASYSSQTIHEVVTKSPEKAEDADEWEKRLQAIHSEIRVLTARPLIGHPNIVRLIQFAWRDTRNPLGLVYPALILEKAIFGTLMDFQQPKIFNLRYGTKLEICADIAGGLAFLHACGVLHGDVKPENILLFPDDSKVSKIRAKLSDFSHSLFEADAEDNLLQWRGYTAQWAAPEVLRQTFQKIDLIYRADVFSYGLVFKHVMLETNQKVPIRLDADDRSSDILITSYAKAADAHPLDLGMKLFRHILEMTLNLDAGCRSSMEQVLGKLQAELARVDQNCSCDSERPLKPPESRVDATQTSNDSDDSLTAKALSKARKISWGLKEMMKIFDVNEACVALQTLPKAVQHQIYDGVFYNLFKGLSRDEFSEFTLQMSVCHFNGFGTKVNPELGLSSLTSAAKFQNFRAMAVLSQIHAACERPLPESEAFENSPHLTGSLFSPERCLLEGCRTLSLIALANSYDRPMEADALRLYRNTQNQLKGLQASGVAHMFDVMDGDRLESQIVEIFGETPPWTADTDGNSLLHVAATNGQLHSVQILLNHNLPPDTPNYQGETPLFVAMRNAELEVTLLLIAHGADALYPNKDNCTPIHFLGVFRGAELDLLMETLDGNGSLQETDIDVDCPKFEAVGWHFYVSLALGTPLHWAMNRKNLEAARYLLKLGADPLKENGRKCSPLHYALVDNLHNFVDVFADESEPWGAKVQEHLKEYATEHAMTVMMATNFQLMLINGAAYSDSGRKTIEVLQSLVAPTNILGPLLWEVADKNKLREARYLLNNHSINVDEFRMMDGNVAAIQRTLQHGDREMFDLLLGHGADPSLRNDRGSTTYLHEMCRYLITDDDMIYFTERLIARGADVNAVDDRGLKPLWLALCLGRLGLAQALHSHGADFSGLTNQTYTVLGFLVLETSPPLPETFEFFFAHCGVQDPQVLLTGHENSGLSVLCIASERNADDEEPLVRSMQMRLLHPDLFGGNSECLNHQTPSTGETALHIAAKRGNATMVRLLLEAGAETGLINHEGQTALDIARGRRGSEAWGRLCESFKGGGAGRSAVDRFEAYTEMTVAILEAWQ